MMTDTTQRGRGGAIIGLILIGLGVVFGLGQIFQFNFWQFTWPFFIIVPGLMFFVMMILAGKPGGPLAIPGSIVTTVGLILLYQSLTGHWASWAYAWSLIIPTSIGVGMTIAGRWSGSAVMSVNGRRVMTVGLIMFLVLGAFFELVLNIDHSPLVPYLWPALMILLGVWLLSRRAGPRRVEAPRSEESRARPPMPPAPPRPPAPPAPPTKPSMPTPPRGTRASSAPQFEPLDASRGKKKPLRKESKGEPNV